MVCGVSELAVLRDLQPGWGWGDWGGQAVPRWGQRHTRVCWTQGGKLPLLQDTKEESADLLRPFAGAWMPAPYRGPPTPSTPPSSPRTAHLSLLFRSSPAQRQLRLRGSERRESHSKLLTGPPSPRGCTPQSQDTEAAPTHPLPGPPPPHTLFQPTPNPRWGLCAEGTRGGSTAKPH